MAEKSRPLSLSKLIAALQQFAQFDSKMQVSTALTLLYVADRQDQPGGVSQKDLEKWVGMLSGTASRNVMYWGEGYKEMPNAGYGLIEQQVSDTDRRRRCIKLTPKGQAFIHRLEELYGPKER